MLINKITHGFVVQVFNTDSQQWDSQEFIAGECEFETEDGCPINVSDFMDRVLSRKEPYLPFEMKQPGEII